MQKKMAIMGSRFYSYATFINLLTAIMRNFRTNIHLPKVFVFLLLVLFLAANAGCGKSTCNVPYQDEPVRQQPPVSNRGYSTVPAPSRGYSTGSAPGRTYSVGKPEVVENSVAFRGGPRTIVHEVGPLETVWRIARMYDVPPQTIYSANNLRPDDALKIGQKLTIPNARMLRHVINLYKNPQWQYIIVHHTATWKGNAKTINSSHGDRGFWNGLGYHFLIDNGTLGKGDGQIEMSPRWIRQQTGAHCKAGGMNDRSIGVALVGNFNDAAPTPNQMQSLEYLLKTLSNYYGIPRTNVLGHGEVGGARTECPGRLLPIGSLRNSLRR
ncbi:MAG: N-acetylmuramoyl-L-alanine amidase [Syntrophobacter sp.]